MGTSFKQSGNTGIVTLEGELTLPNATELRSALIKALIDAETISIAMENVRDVDLSCLQLLCSAHRSAVRLKKHLAFAADPPKIFKDMVGAAGFARIMGCKLDCDKSCLWTAAAGEHNG